MKPWARVFAVAFICFVLVLFDGCSTDGFVGAPEFSVGFPLAYFAYPNYDTGPVFVAHAFIIDLIVFVVAAFLYGRVREDRVFSRAFMVAVVLGVLLTVFNLLYVVGILFGPDSIAGVVILSWIVYFWLLIIMYGSFFVGWLFAPLALFIWFLAPSEIDTTRVSRIAFLGVYALFVGIFWLRRRREKKQESAASNETTVSVSTEKV